VLLPILPIQTSSLRRGSKLRPVIGITASWNEEKESVVLSHTYVDAVSAAGGIPFLIPVVPDDVAEEALSKVDGILFPGGADVDPQKYGERPHQKLGSVNPRLDSLELHLAQRALERGLPVLGVCRGCQLVNIAAGGTLVQDIPSQIGGAMKHRQQAPRWYGTHEVILEDGSMVAEIFGTRRLTVNSYHHQSVRTPGDGLTVSGRALDGVVEVIEGGKGFILLVQWHPEGMFRKNPVFLKPFQALVKAAKEFSD
jgi:putative glutamine amidotransferase